MFISHRRLRLPTGTERLAILMILLAAAALRLIDLTILPAGYRAEEIVSLHLAGLAREGVVSSFYTFGGSNYAREGLFPILTTLVSSFLGSGRLVFRLMPALGGVLSVALLYALTRRLFGGTAGLIAAFALALNPWHVILSRSVVPEALLLPVVLLTLIMMAASLHVRERIAPEPPDTLSYAALGVLLAISAYTQWTGLVLIPLFGAFLAFLIAARQPISRRAISFSTYALIVGLIAGIPYLATIARTPEVSGLSTFWLERPADLGEGLRNALEAVRTFSTTLLGPLSLPVFLFGAYVALRRRREPNVMLVLLALLIGLFPDMWSRGGEHFTHGIVGLPAAMALLGLGGATALQWLREQWRPAPVLLVILACVTVAFGISVDRFWSWAWSPEAQQAYGARLGNLAAWLDRYGTEASTSICTFKMERAARDVPPFEDDPALLGLMLHRQDLNLRFSNCLTSLVLTAGGEPQRVAFADPYASQVVPDMLGAWLANAQVVPVRGLPDGSVIQIDATQIVADTFGQTTASAVFWAPETRGPNDEARLPMRMGGNLTFEGYRMAEAPFKPGDLVTIATYWRADGPQVPGLRLFAHIMRNPQVAPALQNDLLSLDAALLRDRDVFIQIIGIPLPADFPPGAYYLSIGGYSAIDNTRIPLYDEGEVRGGRLFLNQITVAAP